MGRQAKHIESHTSSSAQRFQALRLRVVIFLVLASFVPLFGISIGAWIVFERILAEKSEEHLQTVVSDHAETIELYLNERLMALQFVTHAYEKSDIADPITLRRIFQNLDRSYAHSFLDLGVIDDRGNHLAYVGPYDLLDRNYRDTFWFGRAAGEGHFISDVFLGYRNEPHFILAVRRDDPDGGFWILRASANPEVFNTLVSKGRLGNTGDCFLLDRQGRYQTPPVSGGSVFESSGVTLIEPREEIQALSTETEGGRDVIRIIKWIQNRQWALVAQQDRSEVRAPIRIAMARGMAVFAFGGIVIVLAAVFSTRYLVRLIEKSDEQRERLNLQLLQASKLASIGEMATGLAHEINNPLGIIYSEQTNIGDLLQEIDLDDPRAREMIDNVAMTKKQVDRCKTITQKMLQFGRQGLSAAEEVDPARQLREIVKLFAQHASVNNVELCLETEPGLPTITIDPTEFQQLITNLFNNALQAIEGSGGILVSAWRERDRFHLMVEDTGPGIAEEHLPRIFEPFFTTKPVGKGTGLGLSVCYGIVTEWQGKINVESGPGQGALFHVQFPVARQGPGA